MGFSIFLLHMHCNKCWQKFFFSLRHQLCSRMKHSLWCYYTRNIFGDISNFHQHWWHTFYVTFTKITNSVEIPHYIIIIYLLIYLFIFAICDFKLGCVSVIYLGLKKDNFHEQEFLSSLCLSSSCWQKFSFLKNMFVVQ